MAIREAAAADAPRLTELWTVAGIHFRPWMVDWELTSVLARDPDLVLVEEREDGQIAGSVFGTFDGRRGWVNRLATSPAFRGRGVGAALLAELERRLLAKGCPQVNLLVDTGNDGAIRLYERLGYKRGDAFFMGKALIPNDPARIPLAAADPAAWTAPRVGRTDEPFAGDERAMLEGFLDWGRASLLRKCEGLTGQQLAIRACPPSDLSLAGLVRHMANVERNWFRRRFAGQDVPPVYPENTDFGEADGATAEQDWAALIAEQQAAREAAAGMALDAVYVSDTWGTMSLRWCYSHMVAEYAGHNGHADLLRERIDGATGL